MEKSEANKLVYEDIQQIKNTLRDISFQLERLIIATEDNTQHAGFQYRKLIRFTSGGNKAEWKTIP